MFLKYLNNIFLTLDTFGPGSPTAPRSPLAPVHLHGTPQHSLSAILSYTAKENNYLVI